MSLLFKHLRIHQVFGANTDVGKTILTTALIRASAKRAAAVYYLKPVSTGPTTEADDHHIRRYATGQNVHAECLYQLAHPVSPHLAARLQAASGDESPIPSDETFVKSVATYIRDRAARRDVAAHMYVETAGGVHSPTLSGTTQLDCYRPLFLPTILVGDSKLGGISSTISAYESLLLRGYIIDSILLFRDETYRNWEYLHSYFRERDVCVTAVASPPALLSNPADNQVSTEEYYKSLVDAQEGGITSVVDSLDTCHAARLQELDSMPARTLQSIWWPFVQHGTITKESQVNTIDSAHSDFFSVYKPNSSHSSEPKESSSSLLEPQFDGSASWWTQALGHAHPSLTLAAARAAGRYGHVMFPEATHLPALKLAETLIKDGPGAGWASRAFFSDNGSTGMEVAIKMALRAFSTRENIQSAERKTLGVLGIKGSYHGDTIGAMDACEEGVFTCEWHDAKGYWFDPPTIAIRQDKVVVNLPEVLAAALDASSTFSVDIDSLSWVYDVSARIDSPLAAIYRNHIQQTLDTLRQKNDVTLAALVIEPLLMGAGGMIFVDPLFQRIMIDVVRGSPTASSSTWAGLPVIYDEVFVGLYRIGMKSTAPLLGVNPDITVHAKILTGGLLPLAVTLTTDAIFQAFVSSEKSDALLHGHSYTAHPIGCEVANETLRIVGELAGGDEWSVARGKWAGTSTGSGDGVGAWSFWDPGFASALSSLNVIQEVMTLGTVLAVTIKDISGGYTSNIAQQALKSIKTSPNDSFLSAAPGGAPFGIHFRTLGNVAYFMTSLNTPPETIRSVEDRIWEALK